MAWGSSFDKPNKFSPDGYEWSKPNEAADAKLLHDVFAQAGAIHPTAEEMAQGLAIRHVGWDLGNGADETALVVGDIKQGVIEVKEFYKGDEAKRLIREHTNKVPTHDPYTNPNAHIYYECNCGQILDPGTKRFAELNNYASKAGWKIRFSDNGYIPYCVECGKGVE